MTIEDLVARLYNYALDIVEKRIVAGKKHIWACQRFLKDIGQIEDDSYPFYFDSNELYEFYHWTKLFKYFDGVKLGQPLELPDYHLFIVANIFCWKEKETDYRRFKKVYLQVARKNWKTGLVALVVSYIAFMQPGKSEVYIAGWDKGQSDAGYEQILTYFRNCDFLKGKYSDAYGKITHNKSGSIIKPLSHQARKTGDSKNPDAFVVDEYHNHETTEIYDTLWSGTGVKPNRLGIIITTAGFDLGVPCYKEYNYCSNIIDPNVPIENEQYFVLISELDKDDDMKDPKNWLKPNPLAASFPEGIEAIKSDLREALDAPDIKMRSFKTKRMNVWINQREDGYMNMDYWSKCKNPDLKIEQFKGEECIVGIDLSAKEDLTSIGIEFKKVVEGKPKYFVFSHSFIPQDTLTRRIKTDKQPFDVWQEKGWLTATPGAVVDYDYLKEYIHNLKNEFNITVLEVCFDPYNSTSIMNDLKKEGFKDEQIVEVSQYIKNLTGPTKDLREQVKMYNLEHDGNPVLTWAMSNAVTRIDAQENIMLDKSKVRDRIDPVAALIDAHARMMSFKPKNRISEAIKGGRFRFI